MDRPRSDECVIRLRYGTLHRRQIVSCPRLPDSPTGLGNASRVGELAACAGGASVQRLAYGVNGGPRLEGGVALRFSVRPSLTRTGGESC